MADEIRLVRPASGPWLRRVPHSTPPQTCPVCEFEKRYGMVLSKPVARHLIHGTDAEGRPATMVVGEKTYQRIVELAENPPKQSRRQRLWAWLCKKLPLLRRLQRQADFVIRLKRSDPPHYEVERVG